MMRLAKYLSLTGVASRRAAEDLIVQGRVKVNGKTHTDPALPIDETADKVTYGGKILRLERKVYYIVHKPVGYISAAKGRPGDKLVTDLVPPNPKVYPVGRLDKDSSGLLILTNDGDLAYKLMHPKFQIAKTYMVKTAQLISVQDIERLRRGVRLPEGLARADTVKKLTDRSLLISLHQGWNRQIRRMLGAIDHTVVSLERIGEGTVRLGSLKPGKYRLARREEIHD